MNSGRYYFTNFPAKLFLRERNLGKWVIHT
jgi:hypothetical protein